MKECFSNGHRERWKTFMFGLPVPEEHKEYMFKCQAVFWDLPLNNILNSQRVKSKFIILNEYYVI